MTVFGDDCTFLRRVEVANGHDLRRIRILRLLLRRAHDWMFLRHVQVRYGRQAEPVHHIIAEAPSSWSIVVVGIAVDAVPPLQIIHPSARPNYWYSEKNIFGEKISAMIRHLFQLCVAYFYVRRRTSSVPPKDTILEYTHPNSGRHTSPP